MIKEIFRLLTRGDKFLILILFSLSVISLALLKSDKEKGSFAQIKSSNEIIAIHSLKSDTTFFVQGALSPMKIEIKSRRIRVSRSGCPAKICVKTGWIQNTGQLIACIPNKIVITIENKNKENFLDVVTQ